MEAVKWIWHFLTNFTPKGTILAVSVHFRYPEEIRRIIYTTNIIEAVHPQFRKLTKTKGHFLTRTAC